jgi:hypothetical protein
MERGTPDAHQEGTTAPASVTVSVSAQIFVNAQNNHPRQSVVLHPTGLSSTSACHNGLEAILAFSLWAPTRGLEEEKDTSRSGVPASQLRRSELSSQPDIAARTQLARTGPARHKLARKAPAATLQHAGCSRRHHPATAAAPPQHPATLSPREWSTTRHGPYGPKGA